MCWFAAMFFLESVYGDIFCDSVNNEETGQDNASSDVENISHRKGLKRESMKMERAVMTAHNDDTKGRYSRGCGS
jgi:hypothetical protein